MGAGDILGGRYRLEREVGRGDLGSVWRAVETTLQTECAIKVLHANLLDETARARFMREARIAATIANPGVVRVNDVGEHEGAPFLVMELLTGQSLAERLESERVLSEEKLLGLVVEVLEGLSAVHAQGVIHRGIKPENIFLLEGSDATKLLDVGISVFDGVEAQRRAMTGTLIGTPRYMSPEQALGQRDLDVRTDIWSLGIVMYEALTGVPPYEEDSVMKLLTAVAGGKIGSVVDQGVCISPNTERIIRRALRREPERRFATAEQMRLAVQRARGRLKGWTDSLDERARLHVIPFADDPTEVDGPGMGALYGLDDADDESDVRTTTERDKGADARLVPVDTVQYVPPIEPPPSVAPPSPTQRASSGATITLFAIALLAAIALVAAIALGAWALLSDGSTLSDPGPRMPDCLDANLARYEGPLA